MRCASPRLHFDQTLGFGDGSDESCSIASLVGLGL